MLLDIDKTREKLEEIEKRENIKILFATICGSHLYDVDHAESDIDIRFTYKLPTKTVLGLKNYEENIVMQDDKYDLEGTEIQKFLSMIKNGNLQILIRCFTQDVFQVIPNDRLIELSRLCVSQRLLPFIDNISPRSFGKHRSTGSPEAYQMFMRDGKLIKFPKSFFYAYSYLVNGYFLLKENSVIFNFESMRKEFEDITKHVSPVLNIKEGQEFSFEEIMEDMGKIKDLIRRDMRKDIKKELTKKDIEELNHYLLDERFGI